MKYLNYVGSAVALLPLGSAVMAQNNKPKAMSTHSPRNVIFILSDDHRYDYMGFLGTVPWLNTPTMDFMAANGAYVKNAFVTTSLSSPSRASILTSLFSHEHGVVDNQAPLPEGLIFFPEYLQQNGYTTAFFGKWHMGQDTGAPQPGFDHWEGLKGQGTYTNFRLNIDGQWIEYRNGEYLTDLLTDHTIEYIDEHKDKSFFIYLSHKAVHDPFDAGDKNRGRYADETVPLPPSYNTPLDGLHKLPSIGSDGKAASGTEWYGSEMTPDWVKNQRESWHGVDYSYHGRTDFETECRKYCETLTSLDESMGRLMEYLRSVGLSESTLVIYMGDNGFLWGEHGLIDKRNFYEASVRVPMLAYCPELIEPGTVVEEMVQNIDVAPTIMDACGVKKAAQMRGESFLPLLEGHKIENWRQRIYYEYFWEYAFPHTPTTFGVRTDRYKYIRYHGVWDTNEFFDLQNDPYELHNLIDRPEYQTIIKQLGNDLYDWLDQTGGMKIPLKRSMHYKQGDHRNMKVY